MSAYLIDNKDILGIFVYDEKSTLTADDLFYLSYLHLGVEGLRSLEHYNPDTKKLTQAHSQGYFAIFKYPLHGRKRRSHDPRRRKHIRPTHHRRPCQDHIL